MGGGDKLNLISQAGKGKRSEQNQRFMLIYSQSFFFSFNFHTKSELHLWSFKTPSFGKSGVVSIYSH